VNTDLEVTPFTTDANGEFRTGSYTSPRTFHVTIEAPGYITRATYVRLRDGTRNVNIDLIANKAPFSLNFYRDLARGVYDNDGPWRLLRLHVSPKVYVRTVDEYGRAIEPEVLRLILATIPRSVKDWSNGTLRVATLESGTETRPREPGWIIVNTIRDRKEELCGLAGVGYVDGFIDLYKERCACGSIKIPASVIAHEVGHALGFFHVDDSDDVMYPTDSGQCRSAELSSRERYHAAIVYSRNRDNLDQDIDPDTMTPLATGGPGLVVEN